MATFRKADFIELRVCPYDKNHKVASTKFAAHVAKCAESHKQSYLMECPYNASHRLPENQYYKHLDECSFRPRDGLLGSQPQVEKAKEVAVSQTGQSKDEEEKWEF